MPVNRDTSFVDTMPQNVAVLFWDRVAESGDHEAFRYPRGEAWESVTWKQTGDRVRSLAAGLLSLGLESEQRVGIASSTRYEWIVADLAVMCAGGATTTVYPSTNSTDTGYILGDSECRVVFAEDDEQLAKLKENRAELPRLEKVVTFGGEADGDWVITMDALADLGDKFLAEHPEIIETTAKAIAPDQLATLIYTSGTTGRPREYACCTGPGSTRARRSRPKASSMTPTCSSWWLPLAHSFGKVLESAQLACGFATAIDGRVERIVDNLGIVKPTFMGAAPRIFEKAHARIVMMQEAEGGAKEKIFKKAFEVGLKVDELKRQGKSVPLPLKLQHALFDRLVFSKVREWFGGLVRAPHLRLGGLNRQIAQWFHAAGILILEGYGLTENAAGATVNHPDDYKMGTVGPALPGAEVKIGEGDEVLVAARTSWPATTTSPRRPRRPSPRTAGCARATRARSTATGSSRSPAGSRTCSRTSGGKYIAPSAIELKFRRSAHASESVVLGTTALRGCADHPDPDPHRLGEENGMSGSSTPTSWPSDKVHEH